MQKAWSGNPINIVIIMLTMTIVQVLEKITILRMIITYGFSLFYMKRIAISITPVGLHFRNDITMNSFK